MCLFVVAAAVVHTCVYLFHGISPLNLVELERLLYLNELHASIVWRHEFQQRMAKNIRLLSCTRRCLNSIVLNVEIINHVIQKYIKNQQRL